MTAFIVFNPNADGGRTGRDWQEIETALEQVFPLLSFFVTNGPTQTARVVRDALREGHMEIVAVGGDGTINEALNGFFDRGAAVSPEAVFSFVLCGGNSDLCQKFGIAPGWRAGVAHLNRARIRKTDLGRVTCLSANGEPMMRWFLGAASFGFSGSVAKALGRARIARFFGTAFARALHGAATLWRWRVCRVRLMAEGYDEIAGIASVSLAPQDGLFGVAVTGGNPRHRREENIRKLRSARLTAAPTLDTQRPVDVETDGESAGVLPATFDIYPGAINLRV